MRAKIRIHQYC